MPPRTRTRTLSSPKASWKEELHYLSEEIIDGADLRARSVTVWMLSCLPHTMDAQHPSLFSLTAELTPIIISSASTCQRPFFGSLL